MARRKPRGGLRADRRLLFFALLGAVMGTALDALHVANETAGYEHVWLFPVLNVAWYVPLEFTVAGMVVGMLRPELDEELQRKRSDLPIAHSLWGLVCLVIAWAGSGLLTRARVENTLIAGGLAVIAVGAWALLDKTWQGAVAAFITAAIGVGVETGLVLWTGTYHYTVPDLFGAVPVWLPALYLTACIAVGNLGRFMKYSWDSLASEMAADAGSPGNAA